MILYIFLCKMFFAIFFVLFCVNIYADIFMANTKFHIFITKLLLFLLFIMVVKCSCIILYNLNMNSSCLS